MLRVKKMPVSLMNGFRHHTALRKLIKMSKDVQDGTCQIGSPREACGAALLSVICLSILYFLPTKVNGHILLRHQ